jgi:transcriptional regulator with XRE-family HTH domain
MPRRKKRKNNRGKPRSVAINNIRALRVCAGMTQGELVARSGVDVWTLRLIEQGVTLDPKVSTCIKLANALGVTVGQLLGVERLME